MGVAIALLYFLQLAYSDWVSEWMSPVQEQFNNPSLKAEDFSPPMFNEKSIKLAQAIETTKYTPEDLMEYSPRYSKELATGILKSKLQSTIKNAKILAEALKQQIREVSAREIVLKEAIVNGRDGVSSVLVTPIDRPARAYIIRDGVWTLCKGVVHAPQVPPSTNGYISGPKCFGQEILSEQDPCVFNSVIKYQTVPTVRRLEYAEDDYLCLKQTFNNTLERYMSVPRRVINETCRNGIIRTLENNHEKCGLRVMSEYTYYPIQSYGVLPLEYCAEADGSCKLIMAWHVSNATVENFEFLKNEIGFKKYFIKSKEHLEQLF